MAKWMSFDLFCSSEIQIPEDVDVVFHLASVTATPPPTDPSAEVAAASRLVDAAKRSGARLIFVSSQTASPSAPSAYGRTKSEIEKIVLAGGGVVVRVGQVYGGPERGLFGVLVRAIRKFPVIPAFLPPPMVQPIHVDDLASALLRCAEIQNPRSSIFNIGSPNSIRFTDFMREIARARAYRFRLVVPVPVVLVRLTRAVLSLAGQNVDSLERLISLFDLPMMETEADLVTLGVTLRGLSSGMLRSGSERRRKLLREGDALLAYVLKGKAASSLVRRYVRCIEAMRGGRPQNLPRVVLFWPLAAALLDDSATSPVQSDIEFSWRLNAAVVLAEASVQGARRFLALDDEKSIPIQLISISWAVMLELWWRLAWFVAAPLFRRIFQTLDSQR
jgi:uncharacterized protein YbjT (DUF2867 family)